MPIIDEKLRKKEEEKKRPTSTHDLKRMRRSISTSRNVKQMLRMLNGEHVENEEENTIV